VRWISGATISTLLLGVANDPPYVDPIFAYGHGGDPATTGCAITAGTFYKPMTVMFPQEYEGDYFFADFCSGWIRRLEPIRSERVRDRSREAH
jgi:hypothetical protein